MTTIAMQIIIHETTARLILTDVLPLVTRLGELHMMVPLLLGLP